VSKLVLWPTTVTSDEMSSCAPCSLIAEFWARKVHQVPTAPQVRASGACELGKSRAEVSVSKLVMIADRSLPFLLQIISFLSTPCELARLCYSTSHSVCSHTEAVAQQQWKVLLAAKWPSIYEHLCCHSDQSWKRLYLDVATGVLNCTLEVHDREKKIGFAMSRLPARIHWEKATTSYIARYLSASEVPPEKIPVSEQHRLSFCPAAVRGEFGLSTKQGLDQESDHECLSKDSQYPYRVLEGVADFRVGQGIELQWKMQHGSPFGWWYGTLEQLDHNSDGVTAVAKITFRHFPAHSHWHQLQIRFGDGATRPCAMGGWSGGVRPLSACEELRWMEFFPKRKVVFT